MRVFDALAGVLVRRRWWVLGAIALVTAVLVPLAPRIAFDFTPQAVYDSNDGLVQQAEEFKRTFGYDDTTIMIMVEALGPRDAVSSEALQWQRDLGAAAKEIPGVQSVTSLATLPQPRARLGPPWLEFDALLDSGPVTADGERRVRTALAGLKMIDGLLVSADRRLAAVVLRADPAARDFDSAERLVSGVERLLADRPPPEGYRACMTGLPMLRVDIVRNLQRDLRSLLPLAAGLFVIVLTLIYRRIGATLLPLLAVALGMGWTVGVLVLAGQSLNIVSNILPVLLFVLGMANCVHILNRYAEEGREASDRTVAVRRTMSHMALACLLTTLTTAIGFASLAAARSQVLKAVGWQAVLGMWMLYVTTVGVLGTRLAGSRPPKHAREGGDGPHPIGRFVGAIGHAVANRPWRVLVASVALVALAVAAAARVQVNSYMIETYDEDHPTLQAMRLAERRLSGILPLEIDLRADDAGIFDRPDIIDKVLRVQREAAAQPPVLIARSYADLYMQIETVLAGGPANAAAGQADDARAARLAWAGNVLRAAAPEALASFMTPDGRQARIMLRTRDVGTRRMRTLIDDLQRRLADAFPPGSGVSAAVTGDGAVYALTMNRFVTDLLSSLGGASIIIFAAIAILFRSLRLGLVSVVPNLTPLAMTWGYMGLRGYDMNAANVIVFAVALGIAVDGTIHFLARYREEIERRPTVAEAIRHAFHGTGRAIVMACVLIVGGLSILLLSDFVPCRRFAELTGVTMIGSLVGNLLLLPACLVAFRQRRNDPSASPAASSGDGLGQSE